MLELDVCPHKLLSRSSSTRVERNAVSVQHWYFALGNLVILSTPTLFRFAGVNYISSSISIFYPSGVQYPVQYLDLC